MAVIFVATLSLSYHLVVLKTTMDGGTNATLWGLVKSCEHALITIAELLAPITWPFLALFRLCLLAIAGCLHLVADVIIDSTAAFMTAVLTHPNVVEAAAQVMVAGINAFAAQPDLADKLKQVNQHMTQQDKEAAAVQIGRDLPVFVGGIVQGVFNRGGNNDKNNKIKETKSSEDTKEETKDNGGDDSATKSNGDGADAKVVMYVSDDDGNGQIVEKTVSTS